MIRDALKEHGLIRGSIIGLSTPFKSLMPVGAIIGVVEVIDYQAITTEYVETLSAREIAFGDYSVGWKRKRWAWVTANPVLFDKPIQYTGHQGIRNFDPAMVKSVFPVKKSSGVNVG